MDATARYYKHSGVIGIVGPVLMLVFGLLAAGILGAIYGYAIYYIPLIYVNFFVTLFFGFGVGFMVGAGAKIGQVRHGGIVALFGLFAGLCALYVGWMSWLHALLGPDDPVVAPGQVMSFIQAIAVEGVWEMFGHTPSGFSLYAIWSIEALMIVGLAVVGAWAAVESKPFCESCKKWVDATHEISPLAPIGNAQTMKQSLEAMRYDDLMALGFIDDGSTAFSKVTLMQCGGCRAKQYLTLQAVTVKVDSDKSKSEDETDVVENLILSEGDYEKLLGHWSKVEAEQAKSSVDDVTSHEQGDTSS